MYLKNSTLVLQHNFATKPKEAGCSHGLIYKYPEVVADAKVAIEQHKAKQQRDGILASLSAGVDRETRLKAERDKQEELKRDYRELRDNFQALADDAIKRENALLFRCHELQLELNMRDNAKAIPFVGRQ
ncbi:hypothetical protein LRP52_43125 [Photobacterium sp. ZSDE20]|uniref:Uncharacterized protein n=1 Tax=Photobacterium pectinilyticum TaxID=2906793 RepID=A0ABT1N4C1_9GAMM|nr:hypothetical protein [Photobacterium sp. ZSDE20]MCQ1059600.1 hypothetical protein [Photobacterium sp. ZSDE20]MDD1828965.1 hypothetical protein [Photobacterium sp. ZSDE20]